MSKADFVYLENLEREDSPVLFVVLAPSSALTLSGQDHLS